MFGIYRTILAIFVACAHIGIGNELHIIGNYAVFGFYILSGYLMTLILHDNYGYSKNGFLKYSVNRILRIYPIYWISIALSLCLIFVLGEYFTREYHPSIYYPRTVDEISRNLFLFFFPFRSSPSLTPPSWALTVELIYYLIIGLGISKKANWTIIWFFFGILYHVGVLFIENNWVYKYSFFLAASLPFSTGALIYHYQDRVLAFKFFQKYSSVILLGILFILNLLVGYYFDISKSLSFYLNFIINCLLIISLIKKPLFKISKKTDRFIGDLSYPIYLFHYQAGLISIVILNYFNISVSRPNFFLFGCSLVVAVIIALVVNKIVTNKIDKFRSSIKSNSEI